MGPWPIAPASASSDEDDRKREADGCLLEPGVATDGPPGFGSVRIGPGCRIGDGTNLVGPLSLGNHSVVPAGAVVVPSGAVPSGAVVIADVPTGPRARSTIEG
jgi:serine acetyltransferase